MAVAIHASHVRHDALTTLRDRGRAERLSRIKAVPQDVNFRCMFSIPRAPGFTDNVGDRKDDIGLSDEPSLEGSIVRSGEWAIPKGIFENRIPKVGHPPQAAAPLQP